MSVDLTSGTSDQVGASGTRPATALWFTATRTAALRDEQVAPPGPGQVTVRAIASLVSAGTEMLDLPRGGNG